MKNRHKQHISAPRCSQSLLSSGSTISLLILLLHRICTAPPRQSTPVRRPHETTPETQSSSTIVAAPKVGSSPHGNQVLGVLWSQIFGHIGAWLGCYLQLSAVTRGKFLKPNQSHDIKTWPNRRANVSSILCYVHPILNYEGNCQQATRQSASVVWPSEIWSSFGSMEY